MKTKKKKRSYSLMQNVWYVLRHMWRWDQASVLWMVLAIPSAVFISLLETYMAKTIVQLVTEEASPMSLISYVVLFSIGILLLHFWGNKAQYKLQRWLFIVNDKFYLLYEDRYMQVDYEMLENPEFQIKVERARQGLNNNRITWMMQKTTSLFSAILGLVTYAIILLPLSPGMVIMMVIISTMGYFIYGYNHKWSRQNRDSWMHIWRKVLYNTEKLRDVRAAKDIRLYQTVPWLKNRFQESLKEANRISRYLNFRWKVIDTIFAILCMCRDFLAYGLLVYKVYAEGMPVAEFVLYFNALMMFVQYLLQFYDHVDGARFSSYQFCDFRDFMNDERCYTDGGNTPVPVETCEICFENVGYTYPESQKPTLSHVDFTITKGEKIAIVGPNGAGKTTLVKLLCGLYQPTSGKILADGCDICKYNKEAYYGMFSSVFQDIAFLPKSIAENIALCSEEEMDEEKLQKAIYLSGLEEKIAKLPNGKETLLVKEVQEGAISLSGGETQKLALARALYKNGKILVLDEPTAALDPIAESEIYQKYNELSEGKTALFISHRLASTRFCDRIFYVGNGRVAEMGTHEELMTLGGKYAEMFRVQSQYYKDNEEGGADNE